MTPVNPDGGPRRSRFNLSEWALTHRSLVLYLILVLAVAGVLSYERLGQSEDPPFTFHVMVVKTNWPGATAHEVEQQVTDRVERKLQEVRERRLGAQLLEARRVARVLRAQGFGAAALPCPMRSTRCARRSATSATSSRRHPGPVLQRRVRRHVHQHLRADRRRLRLPRAQGIRRQGARGAAARAGRGEGRLHRRAGREDLHRAVEQQARDARRRAGADHRDARAAERGRRVGRVRHGDRPHLRAADGRVRQRRGDPRHRDPRQQPRVPPGRHREGHARLRRSAAAEDALAGQGGAGPRRHDGQGRRRHRARPRPRPRGRAHRSRSCRSASSSRRSRACRAPCSARSTSSCAR